ncbi:MAG: nitrite reductase small subunit NirD [Candidatus Omnitrophica bacterium]|nr:nitrite reductase small subunit NirD [Candidatus Omnitrophota bacterium]
MSEFVKVAAKSEIPTDTGKLVEAGGQEVALFQVSGKIYAIQNICPHQGGPLSEGGIHGTEVMCPWHGWNFDVTNGSCSFNPRIKVTCFKVKEDGEDIYVES